ncbi:MAG TPA: cytochrome c [Nitrospiria bacterium]|nr:cytochrome c [Nitrospiria bacterium]
MPIAILTGVWFLPGCNTDKGGNSPATLTSNVPEEHAKGEEAFNRYCAACHGSAGTGTDHGPSFIDRIYEPNHHGDSSFFLAPRRGVRAHHWNFGDMPKIEGLSDDDLKQIVGYIRWLQRQAGIQ